MMLCPARCKGGSRRANFSQTPAHVLVTAERRSRLEQHHQVSVLSRHNIECMKHGSGGPDLITCEFRGPFNKSYVKALSYLCNFRVIGSHDDFVDPRNP